VSHSFIKHNPRGAGGGRDTKKKMSCKHPEVEAEKNERGKKEEMKVTQRPDEGE